jgi:hypothetical protein
MGKNVFNYSEKDRESFDNKDVVIKLYFLQNSKSQKLPVGTSSTTTHFVLNTVILQFCTQICNYTITRKRE